MNRSPIEWCDYSNNPITGCKRLCRDCTGKIYCYAYYMAQRQKGRNGYPVDDPFRPTLHFDKLLGPDSVKKPAKIFTVSMGDLFDSGVPDVWRYLVFNSMRYNPQHTFLVLTKQLYNMEEYLVKRNLTKDIIPNNLWLGISQDGLTTNDDDIEYFRSLEFIPRKFVSFEPLLGPIVSNLFGIDWVIIGAQTGPRAQQPKTEWVNSIIEEAQSFNIPIFLKWNLECLRKLDNSIKRVQEFPKEIRKNEWAH